MCGCVCACAFAAGRLGECVCVWVCTRVNIYGYLHLVYIFFCSSFLCIFFLTQTVFTFQPPQAEPHRRRLSPPERTFRQVMSKFQNRKSQFRHRQPNASLPNYISKIYRNAIFHVLGYSSVRFPTNIR